MKYTLIHTAFKDEAKPLVEYFRLKRIQTNPYRLYFSNSIVLIASGLGAKNTLHIESIFKQYDIEKAINIGVVGCKDESIEIGSLFCTNQKLDSIEYASLRTVDAPLDNDRNLEATLVDMEAKTFLSVSQKYLQVKSIFVLKIVSDHLDTTIPKKEFVWKIIEKNLKNISQIVTLDE